MKDIQVIMLKGLMGSGKTTFCKQFLKENQNYKCVNRDALRHMLSNYTFDNLNESLVQKQWIEVVDTIIREGFNLIVDETNLNPKTYTQNIKYIKEIAHKYNYNAIISDKVFEVSLEEAILRDKMRDFSVGESVIRQAYKKYILPEKRAAQSKAVFNASNRIDASLPICIIYDIDGTVALNLGHRSYYDYNEKVLNDVPSNKVVALLQMVHSILEASGEEYKFFAMSGREDTCYEHTLTWLHKYTIPCDALFMRKAKDGRQDNIVKRELYEEHIKGKYTVLYVIDDRPQVLKEWCDLGLFTLNVNQDPLCALGF